MKYVRIILLINLFSIKLLSQSRDTIRLLNPSFEDIPRCCMPPIGWTDCGFKGQTPPDVQPTLDMNNKPYFGVTQKPFEGKTYLGMVVRENETYETVSQKLLHPLKKGKCYSFSIMLCRSDTYLSASLANDPKNLKQFTTPAILRIYGGVAHCNEKQLLAVSTSIENTNWQKYNFQFNANSDLSFIKLEAYYQPNVLFPYNGNLLLDDASDIIEIDCDLYENETN